MGKKVADISMVETFEGKKKKLSKIAGRGNPVIVLAYQKEGWECAAAVQQLEEAALANDHVRCILLNCEDSVTETKNFLKEQNVKKCESFNCKFSDLKNYDVREGVLPYLIVFDEDGKVLMATEDVNSSYLEMIS